MRLAGRLTVRSNAGAVAAAMAGLGVVRTTSYACAREVSEGRLVPLLTDWDCGSIDLHALFPGGRTAKPAARALAKHLDRTLPPAQASSSASQ